MGSTLGTKNLGVGWSNVKFSDASERGVLRRQMQSVTWEAIRGLFPAEFKIAANKAAIANAWNAYRAGRMDIGQVRNYILNAWQAA